MASDIDQSALDYLLTSQQGEVVRKKLKIGEKSYNYDRNKPSTDRLANKLKEVRKTNDYKRYELEQKRDARWVRLDKNKALTGIQTRYKARVGEDQSAFSYSTGDIKVKGIKALQYLKYQEGTMKEFLQQNKGMKLIVDTFGTFKDKVTDENTTKVISSRRYEVTNIEDIPNILSQVAADIEFQFDKIELNRSGLILNQFDKIRINFDKYNPTRGCSFIELPKWIQDKKACINIQNEDNQCFKHCIKRGVF